MLRRGAAIPFAVVCFGVTIGCRPRGDQLADLVEVHGSAERDFAASPEKWDAAKVGESFRADDALRTAAASDAHVRLKRGGSLKLGSKSLVRFRAATPGAARLLAIESGDAEIESGGEALEFDTLLGPARIEAGGRLKLTEADGRAQFEILVGQTVIEGDGGAGMKLNQGEKIVLGIGGAILEHTLASDPPAAPDAGVEEVSDIDAGALGLVITARVNGAGVQVQKGGKPWAPLPAGDAEVTAGTRVRLPKGTSLAVARGNERAEVRGAGEVIVGAPGGALLNAVDGDVTVDGDDAVVRIDVPGGSIVARKGARGDVSVRRSRPTEVKSEQGEVEVRGKNSRSVLTAGQSTTLDRGGDVEVEDLSSARVDFTMPAGESAVVHDPSAPTDVRISFGDMCPGEGEVEFSGSARKKGARSRGKGSATIVVGPGANRYRVRCVDDDAAGDVKAQGSIAVMRDSGAAQLPRKAPQNLIDADGRRYTVLYQNILPQLTVTWPSAPAGKTFIVHVEPERGEARSVDASTASVKFASGQLGEGTYSFWFETRDDAAHRSPKTTLRIDFDNAAPAAHIQEPPAGAPIGGSVTVAGVALEGASVTVSGVDVSLDSQFRFRDQASVRPGESSIAIRISHPKHGIHYYLRRQKGEP
jgi:hypothetical protein